MNTAVPNSTRGGSSNNKAPDRTSREFFHDDDDRSPPLVCITLPTPRHSSASAASVPAVAAAVEKKSAAEIASSAAGLREGKRKKVGLNDTRAYAGDEDYNNSSDESDEKSPLMVKSQTIHMNDPFLSHPTTATGGGESEINSTIPTTKRSKEESAMGTGNAVIIKPVGGVIQQKRKSSATALPRGNNDPLTSPQSPFGATSSPSITAHHQPSQQKQQTVEGTSVNSVASSRPPLSPSTSGGSVQAPATKPAATVVVAPLSPIPLTSASNNPDSSAVAPANVTNNMNSTVTVTKKNDKEEKEAARLARMEAIEKQLDATTLIFKHRSGSRNMGGRDAASSPSSSTPSPSTTTSTRNPYAAVNWQIPWDQRETFKKRPTTSGGGGSGGGSGDNTTMLFAMMMDDGGGSGDPEAGDSRRKNVGGESGGASGIFGISSAELYCSFCLKPNFWRKVDWACRFAVLAILPSTALALNPTLVANKTFASSSIIIDTVYSAFQPNVGQGVKSIISEIWGFSISFALGLIIIAIDPSEGWQWIIIMSVQVFLICILLPDQMPAATASLANLLLQLLRDDTDSSMTVRYILSFYQCFAIGMAMALPAYVIPRPIIALRRAEQYTGVLGNTLSVIIKGTMGSFWCSPLQRELNLVKLRLLQRTAAAATVYADEGMKDAFYEPHTGLTLLKMQKKIELLKSLSVLLHGVLSVIEHLASEAFVDCSNNNKPRGNGTSINRATRTDGLHNNREHWAADGYGDDEGFFSKDQLQSSHAQRLGALLEDPLIRISVATDLFILKIVDFSHNLTEEDYRVYEAAANAFDAAVKAARNDLYFPKITASSDGADNTQSPSSPRDDDIIPYVSDAITIQVGFFLFVIHELCDKLKKYREPTTAPSNLKAWLWSPLEYFKTAWRSVVYLVKCIFFRFQLPRRGKEAIKLTGAMAIALTYEIYSGSPSPISGSAIIPRIYKKTGSDSFAISVSRVTGTIFASTLSYALSVSIITKGGLEGYAFVLVIMPLMCLCGAFLIRSPSYSATGKAWVASSISILSRYSNNTAALSRITNNVVAIIAYFAVSFLVWPVRATWQIQLEMDGALRCLRDASLQLLINVNNRNYIAAIDATTKTMTKFNKHAANVGAMTTPAATEPSPNNSGGDFPEEQWRKISRILKDIGAGMALMRLAYAQFASSAEKQRGILEEAEKQKKIREAQRKEDREVNKLQRQAAHEERRRIRKEEYEKRRKAAKEERERICRVRAVEKQQLRQQQMMLMGLSGAGEGKSNTSLTSVLSGEEMLKTTPQDAFDSSVSRDDGRSKKNTRKNSPSLTPSTNDIDSSSVSTSLFDSSFGFGDSETDYLDSVVDYSDEENENERLEKEEEEQREREEDEAFLRGQEAIESIEDESEKQHLIREHERDTLRNELRNFHLQIVESIAKACATVGDLLYAALDLQLLLVGGITKVPIAHLVRIRIHLMNTVDIVEEVFGGILEKNIEEKRETMARRLKLKEEIALTAEKEKEERREKRRLKLEERRNAIRKMLWKHGDHPNSHVRTISGISDSGQSHISSISHRSRKTTPSATPQSYSAQRTPRESIGRNDRNSTLVGSEHHSDDDDDDSFALDPSGGVRNGAGYAKRWSPQAAEDLSQRRPMLNSITSPRQEKNNSPQKRYHHKKTEVRSDYHSPHLATLNKRRKEGKSNTKQNSSNSNSPYRSSSGGEAYRPGSGVGGSPSYYSVCPTTPSEASPRSLASGRRSDKMTTKDDQNNADNDDGKIVTDTFGIDAVDAFLQDALTFDTDDEDNGEDDDYLNGTATVRGGILSSASYSSSDVHSLEAFVFGIRGLVNSVWNLEKTILELRHANTINEKL